MNKKESQTFYKKIFWLNMEAIIKLVSMFNQNINKMKKLIVLLSVVLISSMVTSINAQSSPYRWKDQSYTVTVTMRKDTTIECKNKVLHFQRTLKSGDEVFANIYYSNTYYSRIKGLKYRRPYRTLIKKMVFSKKGAAEVGDSNLLATITTYIQIPAGLIAIIDEKYIMSDVIYSYKPRSKKPNFFNPLLYSTYREVYEEFEK